MVNKLAFVLVLIVLVSFSSAQNNISINDSIMTYHEYTGVENTIDSNYRFYAFGSFHGHNNAFKIFVEQVKHLYYKANTRVIFYEVSYHTGCIMNQYIQDGKENEFMDRYFYKNDFQYLLNPLFQFNQNLPDSAKIKIIGVDRLYLQYYPDVLYALKMLLPENKVPPDNIADIIKELKKFSVNNNTIDRIALINGIILNFRAEKKTYMDFLEENFVEYSKMINIYETSIQLPDFKTFNIDSFAFILREKFIYLQLKEEINNYPLSNYIGLFGCKHTCLNTGILYNSFGKIDMHIFYSFIAMLNKESNSPVKNEVCAIVILEDYLIFGQSLKREVGKTVYKKMKKMTKNGKTYLFSFKPGEGEGGDIATKKFQYVFFVR